MLYTYPSPAKINLFLHVVGRRHDGYHLLQSVFRLINLCDTISIHPRIDGVIRRTNDVTGVPEESDLAIRAAVALRTWLMQNPDEGELSDLRGPYQKLGADIAVHKTIPMGAGLGGGSSNAATVLLALNRLWSANLSRQVLQTIGGTLGADVPFFIFGQSAFVEGIGDKLTAVNLPVSPYAVFVPKVHVPTPDIFRDPMLQRNTPARDINAVAEWFSTHGGTEAKAGDNPLTAGWHNDLQAVAERQHPALSAFRESFMAHTAAIHYNIDKKRLSTHPPALIMTGSGAGYYSPLPTWQFQEIVYNSPPFLGEGSVFGWSGMSLKRHPLFEYAK